VVAAAVNPVLLKKSPKAMDKSRAVWYFYMKFCSKAGSDATIYGYFTLYTSRPSWPENGRGRFIK
jgi:hypothetical protein